MAEKMTREEAICLHRAMWNWIADVIEEKQCVQFISYLKQQFIYEKTPYDEVYCDCFCCEFKFQNHNELRDLDNCLLCPLDWGTDYEDYYPCEYRNGLWTLCCYCSDWKEQAVLARKIANLPERKVI